ncbi:DUF2809 domain-containing protein [Gemmatimonas sp. UBA7669]|jgi:hypothetical protein|uniref:ribosomal maturation YjgA family protein n=1 Tax=Gemmatimonas sp. UBA7669 TaxID=1946568 RepID=UPI0025C6EFEA|nr:DUF2809 domain-containing protein [Gemmatimonas sp. UBA7669]
MTIAMGWSTRSPRIRYPELIATYGGDTLWAAMVYWLLAWWRPRVPWPVRAPAALCIATAVEFSQLYQAPWIVALRDNPVAALVLGQGFLWTDLVCYAVGVAGAALIDALLLTKQPLPEMEHT